MPAKNIKVSVIIPVYNVEEYLPKCLDSVINQTLKEIEIICIDDCSTDNSWEILQEYTSKDDRIIVLQQETNRGLGTARNSGLKIAKGKYICFIDSDDWVEIDLIEKAYNKTVLNNADICMLEYKIYNEITGMYKQCLSQMYKNRTSDVCTYKEINNAIFCHFAAWGKFYKHDFLTRNNLIFPEGIFFEDVSFSVKSIILADRIAFLNDELYIYRNNRTNSIMYLAKNNLKVLDIFETYKEIHNFLISKNIIQELEYQYYKFVLQNSFYHINRLSCTTVKNKFIKSYKSYIKEIDLKKIIKKYPELNDYYKKHFKEESLLSKIFSVKNIGTHKQITIFGIKIRFKNTKQEELKRLKRIEQKLNELDKRLTQIEMCTKNH